MHLYVKTEPSVKHRHCNWQGTALQLLTLLQQHVGIERTYRSLHDWMGL